MTISYSDLSPGAPGLPFPPGWRRSDVLALAASPALMQAARSLAMPWKWQHLGMCDGAMGGLLPRRGKEPLSVRFDLDGMDARCTCKTVASPCSHVLALLILAADFPDSFARFAVADPHPEWAQVAATDTAPAGRSPAGDSPLPQAFNEQLTAAQSALRILKEWLRDLVAGGFGSAAYRPKSYWTAMADRLVDGHAPGAAALVQQMAALPGTSADWPEQMLQLAGRLYLLTAAVDVYAGATPTRQGDLHAVLGWLPLWNEADRVADRWQVLATTTTRRVAPILRTYWLRGVDSGRLARMDADASGPGLSYSQFFVNNRIQALLCFAHGTQAIDARLLEPEERCRASSSIPDGQTLSQAHADYAERCAANPWMGSMPVALSGVCAHNADTGWLLLDDAGHYLALDPSNEHGWILRGALDAPDSLLFGLLGQEHFAPISLYSAGRWRELTTVRKVK